VCPLRLIRAPLGVPLWTTHRHGYGPQGRGGHDEPDQPGQPGGRPDSPPARPGRTPRQKAAPDRPRPRRIRRGGNPRHCTDRAPVHAAADGIGAYGEQAAQVAAGGPAGSACYRERPARGSSARRGHHAAKCACHRLSSQSRLVLRSGSAAAATPSGEVIVGQSVIEPAYNDVTGATTYVMTPMNAPEHANGAATAPFYVPIYPTSVNVGTLQCAHVPQDNCPDHGPKLAALAESVVPSVYGVGVAGHDHMFAPPASGGDFNIAWCRWPSCSPVPPPRAITSRRWPSSMPLSRAGTPSRSRFRPRRSTVRQCQRICTPWERR
jgi:hypothetical protein